MAVYLYRLLKLNMTVTEIIESSAPNSSDLVVCQPCRLPWVAFSLFFSRRFLLSFLSTLAFSDTKT